MSMKHRKALLLGSVAATMIAASVLADDPNLEAMDDDAWISLTGHVESVQADRFLLDYGDGLVTVEMDDWDDFGETWPLEAGNRVTVYGEVDAGLYQDNRIEASSVYVRELNSYFYASSADEEELGWVLDTTVETGDMTYTGTVRTVSPMTESFTIDTDGLELTVFTGELSYDPLDDEGFQKIEPGDRVSVSGQVNAGFFGGAELFADSVITLEN